MSRTSPYYFYKFVEELIKLKPYFEYENRRLKKILNKKLEVLKEQLIKDFKNKFPDRKIIEFSYTDFTPYEREMRVDWLIFPYISKIRFIKNNNYDEGYYLAEKHYINLEEEF